MTRHLLLAMAAALALAACGGDSDTTPAPTPPAVAVDDAPTGAYVVSVGTADTLAVGKYYAADDGSRLVVLQGADDRAVQLYRRAATGGAWTAVPATSGSVTVTLATRASAVVTTPTAATLAGTYRVALDGGNAVFTLAADGKITAGASTCQISGTVATGALPGTLKLTLATSGCGTLPASSTGVLAIDSDFAPAAFRLLADDGQQTVDLWAYAD